MRGTPPVKITAPKNNVWKQLTNDDTKGLLKWLYGQEDLNLTRGYGGRHSNTYWDHELMPPNKTDVLAYIDGDSGEPARYAKVTVNMRSSGESTFDDILVGPLPVDEAPTTWQPLGYPYTRNTGSIRDVHAKDVQVYDWISKHTNAVKKITANLWPDMKRNNYYWLGSQPYLQSPDGKIGSWIFPANLKGEWAESDHIGEVLPLDTKPPPQAVAPAGARFSIDEKEKYIEWMGFSFYLGFTGNRGMAFYDIRRKGQRILYELSFQEALARYAGTDPAQSTTAYLDAAYNLGGSIVELVPGYDCPTYATFMDVPDLSRKNGICFFEFNADYPMARHSGYGYTTNTKNIYFVVRAVYTVGNYDYMFSYEFYLDGSIQVSVRASGVIRGQYAAGNEEYGYRTHDALSGSMHDHTLSFKADFDILGSANTVESTSFVPAAEKYIWSDIPRNTFKLRRETVETGDSSRLNWDRATQYRIFNRDKPNKYGEYRGYRILPTDGTTHFTNDVSSNLANLVHPFTYDSCHYEAERHRASVHASK
ncbi:hypothetical protein LTR37_007054 [Vermiconidia calcicola]|uniref:Uncharacterized protein n=1 Tax=Vermiconidia calcicola TaxID=1690605 RepID=A0ACC3NF05_9PEZI|nr:hypothetical protein LTR37_007054 [Vermiconidia calcicola]